MCSGDEIRYYKLENKTGTGMNSNYQRVNIGKSREGCRKCGTNLLDVSNFRYTEEFVSGPTYREELCICKTCNTPFVLRYELFDKKGHVYSRVFTEDVNDPQHNWQDNLTEEQKKLISEHLETCEVCKDRLSNEILSDAWFGSIIHRGKKHE